MQRHFEDIEQELKNRLLQMGGLVEEMVHMATHALLNKDEESIEKVFELESSVNQLHIDVDDRCWKFLALQHPSAGDLRFVMATIKINSDLERMGDQAVNIAQSTKRVLKGQKTKTQLLDIPKMADIAKKMLKDSLDAFVKRDVDLAKGVISQDSEENKLKREALTKFAEVMSSNKSLIDQSLSLILIARNLERIGDHATNIAEDVIFMTLGKDIRHPVTTKT